MTFHEVWSLPDRAHTLRVERIVPVISGGRETMERLKLWSLVAGLALGSLVGCARASRNSSGAEDGFRSDREVAEGRQDFGPGTIDGKPSACIKWDKSSRRLSKPPRKAAKGNAVPQPFQTERRNFRLRTKTNNIR
jgi:hypothetical protein